MAFQSAFPFTDKTQHEVLIPRVGKFTSVAVAGMGCGVGQWRRYGMFARSVGAKRRPILPRYRFSDVSTHIYHPLMKDKEPHECEL